MTKDEMGKLSGMLDAFFTSAPAGQRASGNENIFLAYFLALEPYSYAQAREGVIVHSRRSRMYPAPAEIIACMPETMADEGETTLPRDRSWMRKYILPDDPDSVSRYAREHGMTWPQAAAALRGRCAHGAIL